MFICIGQSRALWRSINTEMHEFPQTTAQAVANLTQRVGPRQLAEQHRDQLRPTAKAFRSAFCLVLVHQRRELRPGKMFEELIKQTSNLYHSCALRLRFATNTRPSKSRCLAIKNPEVFLLQ